MKIGIIGAGAAGMSGAWDFVNAGHEVSIFEAEPRVGGLAAGFKDEGWDWWLEKFYHHWFQTDVDVLRLAEEMGVREKVLFPRPKTSFWIDGKIVRSEISPSAIFLPLALWPKFRFGLGGVRLKLMPSWQALEETTAHEWLLSNMGQEGYDKFFRPLLIGKFGEEYTKVNMAWMWARVKARSLRLGTFEGGFQAYLDTLAAALEQKGAAIHLGTPVSSIGEANGNPTLTVNGETHLFDRILATTSPGLLLKLAPGLRDTDYGRNIGSLRTIGAVCVVLATRQQLLTDGTYWLNLPATSADKRKSQFPFLALVEHTNWMDRAHYNGDRILYLGDYVPTDHEYFSMSDEELIERFAAVLPTFNPDYRPEWIRKAWVFRAPYAQPVPYVNHSERVPAIETPLANVFWASMNHVYPWDRGTNYAIELGRRAARQMMDMSE
ncbi:MAG TPA: NAD(P)/FAD-dependent oxidoreductase [Candidatus Limnocylindrales bacterium]|nr:NAD(P)/FAD-dependent oxidoreductase [Candidatus Limnocylindrales bacterium]